MLQNSSKRQVNSHLQKITEVLQTSEEFPIGNINVFSVPVIRIGATLTMVHHRPLALLEDFMLRAATSLRPGVTVVELAEILRVDERMLKDMIHLMVGLVEETPYLRATSKGMDYYESRQLAELISGQYRTITQFPPYVHWHDEADIEEVDPLVTGYEIKRLCEIDMLMEQQSLTSGTIQQVLDNSTDFEYKSSDGYTLAEIESMQLIPASKESIWAFYASANQDKSLESVKAQCLSINLPRLYAPELNVWLAQHEIKFEDLFYSQV